MQNVEIFCCWTLFLKSKIQQLKVHVDLKETIISLLSDFKVNFFPFSTQSEFHTV